MAEPEIIKCRDCSHFHTDVFGNVNGVPIIVAHEMCDRWADGCKTSPDGFCFMAERSDKSE